MRKFICLSISIYIVGFIVAFLLKDNFLFIKQNNLSLNIDSISKQTKNQLFYEIIKNNSIVFFTGIFSFLTLGLLTVLTTFYNGFVFGYLIITLKRLYGNSVIIKNVLPHSIEIVGLIISSSIGFYLSILIFKNVFLNKQIKINFKQLANQFIIGYSLILFAALIEAYVSTK